MLLEALKINPNMQNVFYHSDPNIIAEIIMKTLNEIISDVLAPLRIIPIEKDYQIKEGLDDTLQNRRRLQHTVSNWKQIQQ